MSDSAIVKLRVENLNLQNEAQGSKELKLELDNNRLGFSKLKSENERYTELRSVHEQPDQEQQKKLQETALKERAGRFKMEVSTKWVLGVARKAVTKLNEGEKKYLK